MEPQTTCKYCGFPLSDNFFFCPNCGKKIKEPPVDMGIVKQIGIYALSFLLPPLGLLPAFKYLRQKEPKAKIVGVIVIILTIVSIVLTIQFAFSILNTSIGLSGNSTDQLQQLQNLGY